MFTYSALVVALALICFTSLSHGVPTGAMQETNEVEVIGGFVMFRRINGSTEYLLLEKDDEPGDWSPPKGHTEGDEHPIDAAYRETREETGLLPQHYELLLGYHQYFEYETNKGDEKQVSLWTAQLTAIDQPVVLSDESRDYKWASTHETLQIVKRQYKDAYVRLLATVQCHFDLSAC